MWTLEILKIVTDSLSGNSRGHGKRIIVNFVNRKYAEALLKDKKKLTVKTLVIYMSLTKFSFLFPFAHTKDLSGVNVRTCKDKERFTMFFAWTALSV